MSGFFGYFAILLAVFISASTYFGFRSHFPLEIKPRPQWIILYACSLQAIWGMQLLCFGGQRIAAWSGFEWIPPHLLGAIFLSAAASAYYGLACKTSIGFMLPQQAVLTIAALGSITMVVLGHYADGPVYPRLFIFADQLPIILVSIWHTASICSRERDRLQKIYYAQLASA